MAITRSLAVFTRLSPWSIAIGAMFVFVLVACGDDSNNSSKATVDDDGREVGTLAEMGRCTTEREGDTVYVAEKLTDYLCRSNTWIDLSKNLDGDDSLSSSSVALYSSDIVQGASSATLTPYSSTSDNIGSGSSSSSLDKNAYTGDSLVVKNRSILGVAQKGPFKFGSPVYLRELTKDSLQYTGMVYKDEISSNKGDFVIPKVSLVSPYACVEVHGPYRNEITGGYSKDSISLFALTDLKTALSDVKSESRNKVNVNLLTHLEYNRALYLVRKGYSVYAAKKQADQEIMTAFELPTTIEYSEDLSAFDNSDDNKVNYANASLMALGLLFLGKRNDAEIKAAIDKFIEDFETDGVWDDAKTKAVMADFAAEIDASEIRANVKAWNVLSIPQFETPLEVFWNNVYGLGGCSDKRKGVVILNGNKLSKNYNKYFICNSANWIVATTYQKDTYGWIAGKSGEFKKGNVTDSIYIYENSKWKVAERETTIGLCMKSNAGVVSKFDSIYYICKNNAWEKASVLEYDTYGLIGVEGDVKAGVVNKDKYYVYENGIWRSTVNDQEVALGVCSTIREGVVAKDGDTYYICKSKAWTIATPLEYDTYGWKAGVDGEVRAGNVDVSKNYVYENGTWRAAIGEIENTLGACVTSRDGEVGLVEKVYYICKSKTWTSATILEYDTYGKTCLTDGSIISGEVETSNKYVCDVGKFRKATALEISLNKGCVSYIEGDIARKKKSVEYDSIYTCKTSLWIYDSLDLHVKYGTLLDERDGHVYKTVTFGSQKWMAENLNYADSVTTRSLLEHSWCYDDKEENCAVFGRLYTWAAAIDSVALYDGGKGVDCGFLKTCKLPTKVQGICPGGWHLPTIAEWDTLFAEVGGRSIAGKVLKSQTGWYSKGIGGNGSDSYHFSALPAGIAEGNGDYSDDGKNAFFWCSTISEDNFADFYADYYADCVQLYYLNDQANLSGLHKYVGLSVRCIKD